MLWMIVLFQNRRQF